MTTNRNLFRRMTVAALAMWLASPVVACIPLGRSLLETEQFAVSVSFSFAETPWFEIEIENMPLPAYPIELMSIGVSGEAVLELVITSAGEVKDAKALQCSHEEFQKAALAAVKQWRFRIGEKARDTPAKPQVVFRFEMTEQRPTSDQRERRGSARLSSTVSRPPSLIPERSARK